jgi:SAM-dependent methyltransferase
MKLGNLKPNPQNPRIIKDDKFKKLVKSLTEFPEMMEKRPMVCVTDVDGKMFPLGGNMRLRAIQELGMKEIPDTWVTLADDWTEEKRKEFTIKDNASFGEWNWDDLANEWDADLLADWGVDVPNSFGDSGNDWNYNYKELPQNGDQLEENLGFAPHSMWYSYPRNVEGISENLIALPERKADTKNPHQDKYSRTSAESIRRIVLTYMREGDRFLENCCGWSTFGAIAAMHKFKGVGVDIWDVALEYSRKQIEHVGGGVEIIEADGMNTPFKEGEFDYVYCNPPFMDVELYSGKDNDIATSDFNKFTDNFDRLMNENHRVVKKDGLCTITISDYRDKGRLVSLCNVVLNSGIKAGFNLHDFVVVEVLGVANMYRKKAFEKKRMPKNHEYVITFVK